MYCRRAHHIIETPKQQQQGSVDREVGLREVCLKSMHQRGLNIAAVTAVLSSLPKIEQYHTASLTLDFVRVHITVLLLCTLSDTSYTTKCEKHSEDGKQGRRAMRPLGKWRI